MNNSFGERRNYVDHQRSLSSGEWQKRLSILLWLVGIHSFIVGVGLIIHPTQVLAYWGFTHVSEDFFPAQGGVFHILMAVAYIMGAKNPREFRVVIVFSIIAKGLATIFLFVYYFVWEPIHLVLLSGIMDGVMGLLIYLGYRAVFRVPQSIVTPEEIPSQQKVMK